MKCVALCYGSSTRTSKNSVALCYIENLSGNSKLKFLEQYLYPEVIVKVGGHLDHSSLIYKRKHSAVLPHNCKSIEIIFEYFQQKFVHLGSQFLLHFI